jgi:hypothetical protein
MPSSKNILVISFQSILPKWWDESHWWAFKNSNYYSVGHNDMALMCPINLARCIRDLFGDSERGELFVREIEDYSGVFFDIAGKEKFEEEDKSYVTCPDCGIYTSDIHDKTSLADHGMCFECHKNWQMKETVACPICNNEFGDASNVLNIKEEGHCEACANEFIIQ